MHFLTKIGIILLSGQALGLAILLYRLKHRPRLRLILIPIFLAVNLPWFFIFTHPVRFVPATGWTTSIFFK